MSKFQSRRYLLSTTLISAMALMSASAALAQQAPAEAKDVAAGAAEEAVDTITVTGSRLTSKNVVSSSPVQTITEQAFDVIGAVDTIDLLNTLPDKYRALGRQGMYGDFFSFYLCEIVLKLNGKGGQPVYVKIAGQDSGRCAPK